LLEDSPRSYTTPEVKMGTGPLPFTVLMLGSRNQLYGQPFEEFDPHHRVCGRKNFNTQVRALQSKIYLQMESESEPTPLK
jgi:hypothetical protein